MAEFVATPTEVIRARVADTDVNIDYKRFFGEQHNSHRARQTTETLWRKVTHGESIKAKYSNPLGHKAVESYEVPATWAIGSALDTLQRNFLLSGKTVNKSVRVNGFHRTVEKSSSLIVTPVKKDGNRLVTEIGQDGQTHKRAIYWIPEQQAQNWMDAEIEFDKRR